MVATAERPVGRPRSAESHAAILRATRELLVEVGYDRMSLDAVAVRAGASKSTIYRRWSEKAELVVAAVVDVRRAPTTPDTGSLREDLLACARAYIGSNDEAERLMTGLLTEMARNETVRAAAGEALGAPYLRMFAEVLERAAAQGLVRRSVDLTTVAGVFPAFALRRVVFEGRPVDEDLVVTVVDGLLMPLLAG